MNDLEEREVKMVEKWQRTEEVEEPIVERLGPGITRVGGLRQSEIARNGRIGLDFACSRLSRTSTFSCFEFQLDWSCLLASFS